MSAQTKHTRGPWFDLPSIGDRIIVAAGFCNHVCEIMENTPEAQANARLIAAAPDLLAALERICALDAGSTLPEDVNELCKAVEKARGALSKVRGE
jgi:hypothetical protein